MIAIENDKLSRVPLKTADEKKWSKTIVSFKQDWSERRHIAGRFFNKAARYSTRKDKSLGDYSPGLSLFSRPTN
ncbi:hypothetical protein [Paenibacillus sp. LHD-38]|uniref:hypothetical protein n=1 Tax=Paenibacillus sp. LHD-38 TaxID=3072143 RepID=UPI00280CF04A|nr:hypothetical protein [Paenibacillus sp. LHD-38]MDQ8733121.1 hypothetical protein [Paenibacillus sp. LHD-38]